MEATLQSALSSRGLAVSSFPGKGRGLVSTRDFSPGDIIIDQEPYASTPNNFSSAPCCDGCFVSNNLKRCSACKVAWYCGRTCQKSEWKLHQLECQALKGLSEDRRKMLTPSLRLMVRLLLRKTLQSEKVIPNTATDNYDLVLALVSHMHDIEEKQLVLYAQMANLVNLIICLPEISMKEITENFSRLACNAHSICDDELRPLGTGLYPVVSIINHSCLPNAVLVFEGRTAVVRAVEHIGRGTEVSISYVETAATTVKRKKDLKEQYFFTCTCQRCNKADPLEDATLEGYMCNAINCDGVLFHDIEKRVFKCQRCGISRDRQEFSKIADEVKQLSDAASKCLYDCNFLEAKKFYKTLEELQANTFHSLSVCLLRTHEDIIKVLMELKDWSEALTYCRLTIPVYQTIYPANHVMLGLQYYTCGKLEWLLGHTEAALASLIKAVDVLRITHGTSTPFMRNLLSMVEEARAEASYRCRPSD